MKETQPDRKHSTDTLHPTFQHLILPINEIKKSHHFSHPSRPTYLSHGPHLANTKPRNRIRPASQPESDR